MEHFLQCYKCTEVQYSALFNNKTLCFAFREGEKPKNPMVELFYGRFLAVGVLEGELWCFANPRKNQ